MRIDILSLGRRFHITACELLIELTSFTCHDVNDDSAVYERESGVKVFRKGLLLWRYLERVSFEGLKVETRVCLESPRDLVRICVHELEKVRAESSGFEKTLGDCETQDHSKGPFKRYDS